MTDITSIMSEIPQLAAALANGMAVSIVIVSVAFASIRVLDLFQATTAATRYAIWTTAMIATLAIPAVSLLLQTGASQSATPSDTIAIQTADVENTRAISTAAFDTAGTGIGTNKTAASNASGPAAVTTTKAATGTVALTASEQKATHATSAFVSVDVAPAPARVTAALLLLWAAVALVGLTRLAIGLVRLEFVKRRARAIQPSLMPAPERLGDLTRHFRIAVSDEVASPIACGLTNPTVLLPRELTESLTAAELEPVVLHEVAHLERRDDATLLVQRLGECLLFFNPFVWLLSRRMHEDREEACDAWVVARTLRPEAYVQSVQRLIQLQLLSGQSVAVPGMADRTQRLVDRMRRVLQTKGLANTGVAVEQAAVVVAIVALVVCVASVTRPLLSLDFSHSDNTADVIRPAAMASGAGLPSEPLRTAVTEEPAVAHSAEPARGSANEPVQAKATSVVGGVGLVGDAADLTPANWARLFEVAKGISSDGDRARVLSRASIRIPDHGPTYSAFLDAAATIRSSGDTRRVLGELLRRDARDNLPFVDLIEASTMVRSSGERSHLLRDLIREAPRNPLIDQALQRAVESVSARGDRERLLRAMADR